jgi:glycolate oxidase
MHTLRKLKNSDLCPVFTQLNASHLSYFRSIVGDENLLLPEHEKFESYTHDYTEDLRYSPEVVVMPGNAREVSAILRFCNEQRIPVTAAGARTGLSGGMLAVKGGVVLGMARFNQIVEIDERNLQARVQPGVITQLFMDAVEKVGLFYPVDPASRGSCFIGGNLAESSGGMRAVKYGTTKDYVLDLEVVLADGSIIRTGARTLKNATGYDLTRLMVGSEGTLGIITEATFRLLPKPTHRMLMLAPFASAEKACDAVSAIFRAGFVPSAMEFMEREAIDFAQDYLGVHQFDTQGIEAHLMVEMDGRDPALILQECEKVCEVLMQYDCGEILFADSVEEQNRLWKVRRTIGEATRAGRTVKEEDTVVPRAELAKLWRCIKDTAAKYSFRAFCFGHAGDGNLHVHILRGEQTQEEWETIIPQAVREIFTFTKSLGGTLSGEHGIGLVQKQYMDVAFSPVELALMKGIKDVFDPNGILNPGKVFPDA